MVIVDGFYRDDPNPKRIDDNIYFYPRGSMAEGRRKRVKDRIRNNGFAGMLDWEVLEPMFYPYVSRKDTASLARELISKFGSLTDVLNASAEELLSVDGVTETAALYISKHKECMDYIEQLDKDRETILSDREKAAEYCRTLTRNASDGAYYLVALDAAYKALKSECIGKCNASDCVLMADYIFMRKAVSFSIHSGATFIVVCYYKKAGVTPTKEEILTACVLQSMLSAVGISMSEHIIVSQDGSTFCFKEKFIDFE